MEPSGSLWAPAVTVKNPKRRVIILCRAGWISVVLIRTGRDAGYAVLNVTF